MKTLLKPYIKINAIIALILLMINLTVFFDFDGLFLVCAMYVYAPILFVGAPIAFICYGHYLVKNHGISWRITMLISCIMFIVSSITYAIPTYKWLLGNVGLLDMIWLLALVPAALHMIIFFFSTSINKIMKCSRKEKE